MPKPLLTIHLGASRRDIIVPGGAPRSFLHLAPPGAPRRETQKDGTVKLFFEESRSGRDAREKELQLLSDAVINGLRSAGFRFTPPKSPSLHRHHPHHRKAASRRGSHKRKAA